MADKTNIINPPPQDRRNGDGGSAGWAVAVIIIIALILFFIFGFPRLRDGNGTDVNILDKIKIETSQY